ncbi:uncharacterized protein LOC115633079 [Scaptodrosophila lebanonensis]|uniref:Uncharacterized protein LOC115633079 n=1 Tax=Drosophila lebanonensis TaxID=7225 RepID=A0A6J2UDU0_DROLE|nr:uncharacterized protein LOC115633079 [Scaptodrosophila lebanonensis]
MAFIDGVLAAGGIAHEPELRPFLLDIAYTMMRDSLLEARRYADLQNQTNINVEHIRMTQFVEPRADLLPMDDEPYSASTGATVPPDSARMDPKKSSEPQGHARRVEPEVKAPKKMKLD